MIPKYELLEGVAIAPFSFSSFSALALASSSWKFVRIVRSALKGVGSPR